MTKKKISMEEAKKIGDALKVDWKKFDVEQFCKGLEVEMEIGEISPKTDVTKDAATATGKIALAYLNEYPDYYTRLKKMETQAKK